MRKRIFHITQALKNPKTGEHLFDVEKAEDTLKEYKTFSRWAWALHDKDVYGQEEVDAHIQRLKDAYRKEEGNHSEEGEMAYIEKNQYVFLNAHKNDHAHIVIQTKNAVEPDWVANLLGVPVQCIDFPKGRNAFLDCVEYLTHESEKEQAKGKHRYSDEEIHANFDFRKELERRDVQRQKYGRDLDPKKAMLYDVRYEGKTISQCIEEDPILAMELSDKLKKFRLDYISSLAPPPTRINYYVEGSGGIGKGMICRAIARNLFPSIQRDEDIFFEVGARGAAFEGYDGQPVIIWNDRRAFDLLDELGDRGNVFNVFDTHPTRQKQNVKYGSINLCNLVNIVNSVQPYSEFLDGLAGEYKTKKGELVKAEDKSQSYRRFPFIIPLHEDDFDMLLNKGFMDNTREFLEFYQYQHIRGSMSKIASLCSGRPDLMRQIEGQTVKPIIDKHNELLEKASTNNDMSDDDILKEFEGYGELGEGEATEVSQDPKPEEVEQLTMEEEDGLPF